MYVGIAEMLLLLSHFFMTGVSDTPCTPVPGALLGVVTGHCSRNGCRPRKAMRIYLCAAPSHRIQSLRRKFNATYFTSASHQYSLLSADSRIVKCVIAAWQEYGECSCACTVQYLVQYLVPRTVQGSCAEFGPSAARCWDDPLL